GPGLFHGRYGHRLLFPEDPRGGRMSRKVSFYRKVAYIVAMVPLLAMIAALSQPATITSPGGRLAQLRNQHNLAQARLGENDPATTGLMVEDPKTHKRTSAIDNWLTAYLWYGKAVTAHVSGHKAIRGRSPLLFYSGGPMARINGAAAMQKDGRFFEAPRLAWQ